MLLADRIEHVKKAAYAYRIRAIAIAVILCAILYLGMVFFADLDAFLESVSRLPGVIWFQLVGLSFLSYGLRFLRWHLLLKALGHRVSVSFNAQVYLSAFALTLTPGKVGELVRSVYLHSYGVDISSSVAVFFVERLFDVVAVGALAFFVLIVFDAQLEWLIAVFAGVVTVLLIFRSSMISGLIRTLSRNRWLTDLSVAAEAIQFLLSGRWLVLASPVSVMAWVAQGVSFFVIVQGLGYELPVLVLVGVYCLSILAGAASFVPGGIGATEAAMVLLLQQLDVNLADAVAASLVSRGVTLWLAIVVGVVCTTRLASTREVGQCSYGSS